MVNPKKIRRLMRERDCQARRGAGFVVTADGDHDKSIFPNLACDVTQDGPRQLWVDNLIYIAIAVSFVYLAAILDAGSGRVVVAGWAER
jgi:hypothetical protein